MASIRIKPVLFGAEADDERREPRVGRGYIPDGQA
jgi:hypothetical protein